ncbi:MAG: hypothetical protein HFI38_00355 [Lachnospiraceae bacterium]|jgi:stage III sporulation protein AE|nr:hypothetical protein [Lachnospiraceae bacterium]
MKRLAVLAVCLFLCLVFGGRALAAESWEEGDYEWEEEFGSYDFGAVEQILNEVLGRDRISFGEVAGRLAKGDFTGFWELFVKYARDAVLGEMEDGLSVAWQVLLIAVLGAFFTNLSRAFPDGQMAETGFYVMYMTLAVLLFAAFHSAMSVAGKAFLVTGRLMSAFLPVFFLAVAVQGQLTAASMYEGTVLMIGGMQWVYEHVVLTGIKGCVALKILEGVMPEDFLTRLQGLIRRGVIWIMKAGSGAVIGLQVVQGLLLPYLDAAGGGVFLKLAGAIPGVGNSVEAAAKMALGTAALIRNSIGLAGLLALLLVCLGPLVKLGFLTLLYQGLAAFLQPVSDKRLLAAVDAVGDGSRLLFKALWTAMLLFAIAIGVACACLGRGSV